MTAQKCKCIAPSVEAFQIIDGPNGLGLVASLNGEQTGNHSVTMHIHQGISYCHTCKRYVAGGSSVHYEVGIVGMERIDNSGLNWKFKGRMWIPSLPDGPMTDKEMHRVRGIYSVIHRCGLLFGDGVSRY